MPMVLPGSISQMTFPAPGKPDSSSPPQQSLFFRQRSPVTWQPLAGWQMFRPLGPGAQRRLQHSLHPLHTMPSTPLQKLGPSGGSAQIPRVAPSDFTHSAVQQSWSRAQASPG
jgi:hypothetical protein